MLNDEEKLQICRKYALKCGICETENTYFRLKRDIVNSAKQEGDGHALAYKWGKPGFDEVNPLDFYWGVCQKCSYAGELDDAGFRQAERNIKQYREGIHPDGMRSLLTGISTGSGMGQALSKRLGDADPLVVVVAQFHLGIYSQCLRQKPLPGNLARYYLRLAWIYRDAEKFYPNSSIAQMSAKFTKLSTRFKMELPKQKDYPVIPEIALTEEDALRFARSFFERNYETLREAKVEDELRLRFLLAEIGYRLYELSNAPDDFKKAAAYFSGTMQQCLSIVSDKSIVGGAVNRAKEMLEKAGERGRELRILHKKRGGDKTEGAARVKKKKPRADEGESVSSGGEQKKKLRAEKSGKDAKGEKKAALVKGEKAKEGESPTRESNSAVRQVAILKAEVDKLQVQVKELEEDNKRWKQMAGIDTITGLPSKAMLVRMVLPKVLKGLKEKGPYSCMVVSLDQFAHINQAHGWKVGDHILKESARKLTKLTEGSAGADWYRLDGAHFVLLGAMDNNAARQRSADLRRRLAKENAIFEQKQMSMMASIGLVCIDRLTSSANEGAGKVYEALMLSLHRAKGKGGNTVEMHNETKF